MKGKNKRRKNGFIHRYQPPKQEFTHKCPEIPARIIRTDQKLHDFVTDYNSNAQNTNSVDLARDTDGDPIDMMSLRPKPSPSKMNMSIDGTKCDRNSYIILHRGKLEHFWNTVFEGHSLYRAGCGGRLTYNDDLCDQFGLGQILAVKCTVCHYKSDKHKIYDEVDSDTGRKTATITKGLQIGLSKQGIGGSGIREILLAANINPPSRSTLARGCNSVADTIIETNKSDMNHILEDIKLKNLALGRNESHPIPAEADGTYNNPLFSSSGSTPYQAGTQTTFLMAEGLTKDKKIISARTYSKICSCVITDKKPNHLENCSANLKYNQSIGHEGVYLRDSVSDINSQGVTIGDLTLDGDSSTRAAAQTINQPDNKKNQATILY